MDEVKNYEFFRSEGAGFNGELEPQGINCLNTEKIKMEEFMQQTLLHS